MVKNFINSTFPEGDLRKAREEVDLNGGVGVVRHALERNKLVKENDELSKQKESAKQNFDSLTSELEKFRGELATAKKVAKLVNKKKKLCEDELDKRDKELEESSTFSEIVDLHRLPTMVLAFTNYKKMVKAQHPKVDVTSITFGPQEWGVEEDEESKIANFHPEVKLKWNRDESGWIVYPSELEYEFGVEDEEAEAVGNPEVGDNIQNQ
ncbi:hypothetical protein SLEP1_g32410 [Rubroshorea leprosula]|uniref:Uncharacterized protein n=1 Tax=Rubroshorea leprosula TaxID=152421 RepID=A0AAV5KD70_9ROSI|nr:hypothetical protein SLEP1_g32410 [Rubroshorea leprosula]